MDLLDILLEPLSYDFMVRAIVTTALAAIVCAVLSCWLVLIGWSLMGDAVSHAVLPGVVLAYIVGAPVRPRCAGVRADCRDPDRRGPEHQPGEGGRRDRHRVHLAVRPGPGAHLRHAEPDRPEPHHLRQPARRQHPGPHPGPGAGRGRLRHPDPEAPRPDALRLRPHARPRDRPLPETPRSAACWACWR